MKTLLHPSDSAQCMRSVNSLAWLCLSFDTGYGVNMK